MGIFSWAVLEPEEGRYEFDWMEKLLDLMQENGISVLLATPSGARPKWMADKYPEVLRVDENRNRIFLESVIIIVIHLRFIEKKFIR